MKKTLITTLLGVCAITSQQVDATNCGAYVELHGGANFLNIEKIEDFKLDTKTGFYTGAAVGYKFECCLPLRLEGELTYRHNACKKYTMTDEDEIASVYKIKSSSNSIAAMANAYIDFDMGCCITPYIGGGIGYARLNHDFSVARENEASVDLSVHSNRFAYQGMAGLTFAVCDKVDFGVEYRYFGMLNSKMHNHGAGVNVKRYF